MFGLPAKTPHDHPFDKLRTGLTTGSSGDAIPNSILDSAGSGNRKIVSSMLPPGTRVCPFSDAGKMVLRTKATACQLPGLRAGGWARWDIGLYLVGEIEVGVGSEKLAGLSVVGESGVDLSVEMADVVAFAATNSGFCL